MSDESKSPDNQQSEIEKNKQLAADRISKRAANKFCGDPQIARQFAELDGE